MRGRQGDGSGEGEGVDGMACKGEKDDVGGTVMEAGWAGGRRVGCKGEERREGYAGGGVGGRPTGLVERSGRATEVASVPSTNVSHFSLYT